MKKGIENEEKKNRKNMVRRTQYTNESRRHWEMMVHCERAAFPRAASNLPLPSREVCISPEETRRIQKPRTQLTRTTRTQLRMSVGGNMRWLVIKKLLCPGPFLLALILNRSEKFALLPETSEPRSARYIGQVRI